MLEKGRWHFVVLFVCCIRFNGDWALSQSADKAVGDAAALAGGICGFGPQPATQQLTYPKTNYLIRQEPTLC
jgi:hypothetical protein